MRLIWSRSAADDLTEIRSFIRSDNPNAARMVARRILESANRLRDFPDIGREGTIAGTRERVVAGLPYILVYRPRSEAVEILRVLHGARNHDPKQEEGPQ
ncbi:MAG: type II toxin-antitoxin system RelE/ParE family toxin [Alphaproteobacteria bacterium]|nr:type II toxin-antitoxin system RelE/ParE family toxin [Alphaproteobacteria bacterium]